MNFFGFSGIIIALTTGFIAILMFVKKSKLSFLWGLFVGAVCLWGLGGFFIASSQDENSAVLWWRISYLGVILIPVFLNHFINHFLKLFSRLHQLQLFFVYVIGGIFIFLNFFSNLIISQVRFVFGQFYYISPPALFYTPLVLFFILVAIYNILLLAFSYVSSSGLLKKRIGYVTLGLVIGFGGGSFSFLPVYQIDLYPYLNALIAVGALIVAYIILKYRFLDIRSIILRTIAFGAIVFIITGIFSIISAIITYLFAELAGLQSNVLSGVILAVLVTVFYKPLRDIIERATNAYLYKKSYDPDVLIGKINHLATSVLDFDHLLKSICAALVEALHAEKIGVTLLDKKGKLYIAYEDGFAPGVAAKLARGNEKVLHAQFKRTPGIFVIEERKTEYENGENVDQIVSPKLMMAMYEQDLALVVPLRVQDKLIGVIAIGTKKSGEPYGSQDVRVLNFIAGPVGVAVENATLFAEQKRFAIILKEEVKQATQELKAANTELKRLDESKSEFISIASHQLRTPLTIIKGFISMIGEKAFGVVPELIGKQLGKVYEANERLIRLVEDLLNVSRIESGKQQYVWNSVDLFQLADGVVQNLLQNANKKGLTLTMEKPAKSLPKVVADEAKLHEVMINFVDNAIKYTPKGEVRVRLEAKPAGMITFSVADTGMGMSQDTIAYLFQKFSRGKGTMMQTEGSGLGLYVAKKIIEVHEGKIWAESQGEGKGSTFAFAIPTAGPKVRPAPPDRRIKIKTPEQLAEQARR